MNTTQFALLRKENEENTFVLCGFLLVLVKRLDNNYPFMMPDSLQLKAIDSTAYTTGQKLGISMIFHTSEFFVVF